MLIKKRLKRLLPLLLALGLFVSVSICASAEWTDNENVAAGEKVIVNISENCGDYKHSYQDGEMVNIRMSYITADDYSLGSPRHGSDGKTLWAYCIQFDVNAFSSYDRAGEVTEKVTDKAWTSLSAQQRRGIMLATLYGYPVSNLGASSADAYAATQVIIWEFQTGVRTSTEKDTRKAVDYSYSYPGASGTVHLSKDYFYKVMAENPNGIKAYNNLIEKIYSHDLAPSFAESKIELDYDSKTKKYTKTLKDENGALSSYDVSVDKGITATVSGNKLTLTSSKYVSSAKLSFTKKDQPTTSQGLLVVTPTPYGQTMVIGQRQVAATYMNTVSTVAMGSLEVVKVDKTTSKPIKGAEFKVYNSSDKVVASGTSDENGRVVISELLCGDYYVVETSAPEGYQISDEKYEFTIKEQNQVIKKTFEDEPVMHKVSVYKKGEMFIGFSEDNTPKYEEQYLDGCEAEIVAAEDILTGDGTVRYQSGEVVETLITTKEGPTYSNDLFEGKYFIREKNAPSGYVLNAEAQPVELFGDNSEIALTDTRQKCTLTFKKSMSNTTGEALSRCYKLVSFGVYTGEEICGLPAGTLLEVMRPDEKGNCTMTVDLPIGYKYYVKEITTADGFILDENEYYFTFDAFDQTQSVYEISINENNEIVNEMVPVVIEQKVPGESGGTADDIELPETGDYSNEIDCIFIMVALVSFISLSIIIIKNKKLTLYH